MGNELRPFWRRIFSFNWKFGSFLTLICIAFAIFFVGIYIGKNYELPFSQNPNDFGSFGSFVGGIFTIVAATVAYLTLFFQIKESSLKSFEDKFFQLLTLFVQRRDALVLNENKGSKVFSVISNVVEDKLKGDLKEEDENKYKIKLRKIVEDDYANEFSVLLLPIKTIFAFVGSRCPSKGKKTDYILIFYSQLTKDEVKILNYIKKGFPEYKKFMDEYPEWNVMGFSS